MNIQGYDKLYARSNTGKVLIWWMERTEEKYRACHGLKDGEIVESEWTVAKPKNVGKRNETDGAGQAHLEILAKYKKQKEQGGYWDKESDIDKSAFFQPQLAHKWEDYQDEINWEKGIFVSPKLDGLRCIITKAGAFSRNGKKFVSFPHIIEKLKPIFVANPELILDGEIYCHEFKQDFNKIISLAKKTKPTVEDLQESERFLQYWIFDMPSIEGGFSERFKAIKDLANTHFRKDKHIVVCPHKLVFSIEDFKVAFHDYILEGFEGLMANVYDGEYEQKRSKNILKYKEFIDEEFEILDIVEGEGNRSGMFGRAILKLKDGKTFESNARGNESFYKELLEKKNEFIGKMVTVRYQNLTPDGVPRFPVIVGIRDYE
jgi:DNA ligase 1